MTEGDVVAMRRFLLTWNFMPERFSEEEQLEYARGHLVAIEGGPCPPGKAAREGYQSQKKAESDFDNFQRRGT